MSTSDARALSATRETGTRPFLSARTPRRLSRVVFADIVGFGDALGAMAGFLLPAVIYTEAGGLATNWSLLMKASLAAALVTNLLFRFAGMYAVEKMHDFPCHPGPILAAVSLALVSVTGLGAPEAIRDGHAWVWFVVAFSAMFTFILLNRTAAHAALAKLTAAGHFDERVAVFGAGAIARRVREHLSRSETGIFFAGVYDDRKDESRLNSDGLDVTGQLDDLIEMARSGAIDRIVIALPQSADNRIAEVARRLESLPVSVHIVTHIASDLVDEGPAHRVSAIGRVGLLDVKKKPLTDWAPILKRLEDLIVGGALTLAALPILPLIALAIWLDSPGPVLFRQRRVGLNRKPIEVLKFRTMFVSGEDDVRQATPGDQRVTRVGRFLRRTSLDELPQLFNVLKGDMSLVGPRPHAIEHDSTFERMIETYAFRHQVKPGLTGLAQVMGLRGVTRTVNCVEARLNADITYIRNWSIWLDLRIIAATAWAVIRGDNAH